MYEVDTVIWFQPVKEAKETALHLADLGIRLLGVANDGSPSIPCRYQVRREPAIRTLLSSWKERTTERLILVQSKDQRSLALEETLHTLLDELEMKWSAEVYEGQRSDAFLRGLQKAQSDHA